MQALEAARAGRDWVTVTGTSSGKTLGYNLPILETALADPEARALYLYPTKALAQDQFRGLLELLQGDATIGDAIRPGVYDGDTPTAQRRRIKAEANLVLSNPDMLHAGILPYHAKWARFFAELRYVVLDEVHTYRGILGANVAAVLRRLQRVCEHYESRPLFLATSATIANPGELTSGLIDRDVQVIDDDGSPRGEKYFVLWNPDQEGDDGLSRRSGADDAVFLLAEAAEAGAQALAFARTRQGAELIHRYLKEELHDRNSPLEHRVRAYRGGYLPNERRTIEQELFSGQVRAAAATNALELGVDIGSLDVVLLVGYPGTIASCWQQAGRSGRRSDESLAVLIAGNDPVDQYLVHRPEYFFSQTGRARSHRPNESVHSGASPQSGGVRGAARGVRPRFASAPTTAPLCELLADSHELHPTAGKYYFAGSQNPAVEISLRHMSDNTFSIIERRPKTAPGEPPPVGRQDSRYDQEQNEVIANVDAISAPELVYPEAVYLHDGRTYYVRELDLEGKAAYVERREMDYYTQAVLESRVRIDGTRNERSDQTHGLLAYGEVNVAWQTVAIQENQIRHAREYRPGSGRYARTDAANDGVVVHTGSGAADRTERDRLSAKRSLGRAAKFGRRRLAHRGDVRPARRKRRRRFN